MRIVLPVISSDVKRNNSAGDYRAREELSRGSIGPSRADVNSRIEEEEGFDLPTELDNTMSIKELKQKKIAS